MNKENFKKYNQQLAEQQLAPLANPRNAASGSLRIKDPKEVSRRNLEVKCSNARTRGFSRDWRVRNRDI